MKSRCAERVRKSISTLEARIRSRYGGFLVSSAWFANQIVPQRPHTCYASALWIIDQMVSLRLAVVGAKSSYCIRKACTWKYGITANAALLRRRRPESQRKRRMGRTLIELFMVRAPPVAHHLTVQQSFTFNPQWQGGRVAGWQGNLLRKASCSRL